MALIYSDSFRTLAGTTDLYSRWIQFVGSGFSADLTGGRDGTTCLSGNNGSIISRAIRPLSNTNKHIRCAFWLKMSGTTVNDQAMLGFSPSFGGTSWWIGWYNGKLMWKADPLAWDVGTGSRPGGAGADVEDGEWHHFEIDTLIDTTGNSGYRKMWVDGVVEFNLTGYSSSPSNVGMIRFGPLLNNTKLQDLVIWDDTGTEFVGLLGAHTMEVLHPNANGSSSDFTAVGAANQYEAVDEPVFDSDTSYVHSATPGDRQMYTMPAIANPPAQIFGVGCHTFASVDGPGPVNFQPVSCSGGNYFVGDTLVKVGSKYEGLYKGFGKDPNTGVDWSTDTLEEAEFGFQVEP